MKLNVLIIFSLSILSLLIAGCQTSVTAPTPTVTVTPETVEEYPAPVNPPILAPAGMYPGPSGEFTNFTAWEIAESALLDGLAAQVYTSPTGHLTIILKDGGVMLALEPIVGEYKNTLAECGEACKEIEVIED